MTDLPVYIYNREFNARLDKEWKTWADPALLAVWYGPGDETVIHDYDVRPGGRWLNEMKWMRPRISAIWIFWKSSL